MHVRDVGLRSAPDPVVLARAVDDQRVLVTLDTDFGALVEFGENLIVEVAQLLGCSRLR